MSLRQQNTVGYSGKTNYRMNNSNFKNKLSGSTQTVLSFAATKHFNTEEQVSCIKNKSQHITTPNAPKGALPALHTEYDFLNL